LIATPYYKIPPLNKVTFAIPAITCTATSLPSGRILYIVTNICFYFIYLFYYYYFFNVAPSWEWHTHTNGTLVQMAHSYKWHTCTNIGHLLVSYPLLVNIITNVMRTQQLHLCVQVPPPLQAPDVDLLTSGGVVPPPGSMVPDMQTEIVVQSSPPSVAM